MKQSTFNLCQVNHTMFKQKIFLILKSLLEDIFVIPER